MTFIRHIAEMGEALLENGEGCTERQMIAFINVVKFFEYKSLAVQIIANAYSVNGRYRCKIGMINLLTSGH